MDEKSKIFLVTIAHTLAIVILWMMVHMTLGIYKGYAFFEKSFGWKNLLYYIFLLTSTTVIAIHLFRKWRKIYHNTY